MYPTVNWQTPALQKYLRFYLEHVVAHASNRAHDLTSSIFSDNVCPPLLVAQAMSQ